MPEYLIVPSSAYFVHGTTPCVVLGHLNKRRECKLRLFAVIDWCHSIHSTFPGHEPHRSHETLLTSCMRECDALRNKPVHGQSATFLNYLLQRASDVGHVSRTSVLVVEPITEKACSDSYTKSPVNITPYIPHPTPPQNSLHEMIPVR